MKIIDTDIEKLNKINEEYSRLTTLLTYEEIVLDNKLCLNIQKQVQQIKPIASKYQEYINLNNYLKELNELYNTLSKEEKHLAQQEIETVENKISICSEEISTMMKQYNATTQHIVIEIVVVKDESNRLIEVLTKGYTNYCTNNNLKYELVENKSGSKIYISGTNAKVQFEKEIGVHKDKDSTSLCQVFVYDDYKEEIEFSEKDISIVACHSSGAGGQHINTTDSAIKVTHLPTGISTICQDERSQLQNKMKAIENLKTKVYKYNEKQKNNFFAKQRTEQLKLIKNNFTSKIYDYNTNMITKHDKQQFTIQEFLSGKGL